MSSTHKTILVTLALLALLVFVSIQASTIIHDEEATLGFDEEDEDEEMALDYDNDDEENVTLVAKIEEQQTQEADTRVLFAGATASAADFESAALTPVTTQEMTQSEAMVQV